MCKLGEKLQIKKIGVWLVNSILIGKLTGMHVYVQWLFLATSFSCVFLGSWCMHVSTVQNSIAEHSLKWRWLGMVEFELEDWLYLCAKIVGLVMVKVETDS